MQLIINIVAGTPFHPSNDRFWQIVAKYGVTKFYTAPTAIRALMKFGEDFTKKYDLSSLKVLGTVGEMALTSSFFNQSRLAD